MPPRKYLFQDSFDKRQLANQNLSFAEGLTQSQLMFSNINPQKAGVKRRVIKKFQACKSRLWESRWVLHPGPGEAGGQRPDRSVQKSSISSISHSQASDQSHLSALESCKLDKSARKFPRFSTDPVWIKKWVSKDNFNPHMSELSCSGVDLLTQKEIDLLRRLQSSEAHDYARGFYFNEFFESIKVMHACEQCEKEFFDVGTLRDHIIQRHTAQQQPAQQQPKNHQMMIVHQHHQLVSSHHHQINSNNMHNKPNPAIYYPAGKVPHQVMNMYSHQQQSGKSTAPSSGYTTPLKNHHY